MGSMNTLNESIRKESFAHRHLPNATQQDCSVGGHILSVKNGAVDAMRTFVIILPEKEED